MKKSKYPVRVLDNNGNQLTNCKAARARKLLMSGRAKKASSKNGFAIRLNSTGQNNSNINNSGKGI